MKTWDDRQLKFEIEGLDEVADDAAERLITPEEAAKISQAAKMVFAQMRISYRNEDGCAWFDDYLKLVEQGWPWRVATYIAWAASVKDSRFPKTLKELATDVLGLTSPRVIYVWREKYPTIDQVVALMQAAPLYEHRRDVIEALIKSARDPNYKNFNDRRLFLEMIGDYIPKSKLEIGKTAKGSEEELSDDDLRAAAGEDIGSASSNSTSSMTNAFTISTNEDGYDAGE